MSSMTNSGHWPGADRRRHDRNTIDEQAAREQADALAAQYGRAGRVEPLDPTRYTTTSATGYDARELDDDGRAALTLALRRRGFDERFIAERFVVGRTRRGYVLGVTEYDHDGGEVRVILGQPVMRQHLVPVELDELPAACRAGR